MEFNLADVFSAIAEAVPERECLVHGARRLRYGELLLRVRRLGNVLLERGLAVRRERPALASYEAGQDTLGLYLHNGSEYLEGMLGAYAARVAPFNVNYRYVEEELVYLLRDARARALVYHAEFAPRVAAIRAELPELDLLLQVDDDSGHALLPGAVAYEAALASAPPTRPSVEPSPDDLYILYTGGTTGMPKGVLWRQADIFMAALGGRRADGRAPESLDELRERAHKGGTRALPAPPFMHGAAHWAAFTNFHGGHTLVLQENVRRFDPEDVLGTVEREQVSALLIVGDAFGRPLLDELRRAPRKLPSLRALITGGAPLSASLKEGLLEQLPSLTIVDAIGSSETGGQGQNISTRESGVSTGSFTPGPDSCVLAEDLARVLEPGADELGWFAKKGRVPLGYLWDAEKTRRTFPTVAGVRYSVPGDRARHRADGIIEVFGRDSQTINSGGEKIFAEEVEHALKQHPAVYDAVVVGRPSQRWGQEVVAIVQLRPGARASDVGLLEECSRHLARYKHPKAFLFRDPIARSPSGKADYRWAKAQL